MTASDGLRDLLAKVEAVQKSFVSYSSSSRPIATSGLEATFPLPSEAWLVPALGALESHRLRLLSEVNAAVQRSRDLHQDSLLQTLRATVSLGMPGDLNAMTDEEAERKVIATIEASYMRSLAAIKRTVKQTLQTISTSSTSTSRKPGCFTLSSINVLEAAFSRCAVLSQRECSIVAKAASITHQQVRTWFQNKRNRKRGGARNTSAVVANPQEDFIFPSKRIISSLPKRALQPSAPAEDARPIRGLPKRAKIPSPSPSTSSVSTIESIAPAGGFQSTFTGAVDMPVISFAGSSVFDPSTISYPLAGLEQTLMPFDGSFDYSSMPVYGEEELDGMFNPEQVGNMLQEALANPTLATSPTFTTSTSSTSPQVVPDDATKEAIDNMSGEELFAMLEQLLSKSSHSTSGSVEGSEELASAEFAAMSGREAMTPLDLSMLSYPSSGNKSPSLYVGPESSTEAHLTPSPVDFAPLIYPQLDIYPATPKPAHAAPAPHVVTYQRQRGTQVIPTMQPTEGCWIPGALPFDGTDQYFGGAVWMMDGQGYTHPIPMVTQGVSAKG